MHKYRSVVYLDNGSCDMISRHETVHTACKRAQAHANKFKKTTGVDRGTTCEDDPEVIDWEIWDTFEPEQA